MEILYYLFFLIIFILWQIFPSIFLWVYLFFILLFLFFTVMPLVTAGKYFEPFKDKILKTLTEKEYNFLKKNAIYYFYPFGARSFSATCSFLYLSGAIFAIVFLIRGLWVHAIISALNILVFPPLAFFINRAFFLFDSIQHGKANLEILDEAQMAEKLNSFMLNQWPKITEKYRKNHP